MVFLCVSLDEFVLMVRAARIISRKVGKEDRAEWYQQFYDAWWRSSDFQGSKGPSCSQPPVFFYSLQREFLETFKIEVFDLQVGSNMKQYWVPWNG
jgi:hypothetical protein